VVCFSLGLNVRVVEVLAERVATLHEAADEGLIDDDESTAVEAFVFSKFAATNERDSESAEVAGINVASIGVQPFTAGERRVFMDGEGVIAAVSLAGENGAESGSADSGERADALE